MHQDFLERAKIMLNEYLLKTEELFVANKNDWFTDFFGHFQSVCAEIVKLQNESTLPAISYLEYTMLRANFINRQYLSEVFLYCDRQYLDKKQCLVGEYDISFLFVYFDELWNKLLSERKRYVGKVKAREITYFMMESLPDFYSYLANIARFAIVECVDKSPFLDIKKNDIFRVSVGEYMAKTEPIFTESKHKSTRKLVDWFDEHLYHEYIFGDYSDLDFSEKVFDYIDFRYARFQNSHFNNTVFNGSILIGANFRNAIMEGCKLDNCSIFETDFSNALLRNASLTNTAAKAGLPDEKKWKYVGFLPASFHNSDLTSANFSGANLTGADFTGAILTNTDFTNAVLNHVNFTNAVLVGANFTGAITENAIFDSSIDRKE